MADNEEDKMENVESIDFLSPNMLLVETIESQIGIPVKIGEPIDYDDVHVFITFRGMRKKGTDTPTIMDIAIPEALVRQFVITMFTSLRELDEGRKLNKEKQQSSSEKPQGE